MEVDTDDKLKNNNLESFVKEPDFSKLNGKGGSFLVYQCK